MSQLRSRRGFDSYLAENCFADAEAVCVALQCAANPITQAFLLPWTPKAEGAAAAVAIEQLVERKLRSVEPASTLHRSLVEVVRRQYKVFCQDRDRADKEAIRTAMIAGSK
ncbi:MAG TPA: hypothetical protein VN641_10215 [Urbifossiella sp.]|nr:hypothetical protein [Urbifossiella sp.]